MSYDLKTFRWVPVGCCFLAFQILVCAQNTSCPGALGPNVFPDGTLGSGTENILPYDPGIAPGYWYTMTPPPVDGAYCVANSTDGWTWFAELFWLDIGDNSPDPNGYMMVVNADYTPGIFYQRTVSVCQNTPYIFSADIINLFLPQFPDAILPNVDFLMDGNVVYSTGDIPMDMSWHTYEFAFTPPQGVSQFTFALRNNAPGGFGNDLALDNISLRFCGPKITLPQVVTHCDGVLNLQPSFQGNPWQNAYYQWQTSFDSGQNWTNISGANGPVLMQTNTQPGQRFRLLMAGAPGNLSNPYCRAVSNEVVIETPVSEGFVYQSICHGESLEVAGQWFSQAGIYEISLSSSNGCDSLLTLELEVLPNSSHIISAEICEGEIYHFGNQNLNSNGNYSQHLTNQHGCDSLVELHLTVHPTVTVEIFEQICEGGSFYFDGQIRNVTGDYSSVSSTSHGCDSTAILHLQVLPELITNLEAQICQGSSYLFDNQMLTSSGNYQKLLQTVGGCDSLVILDLTVLPIITNQISANICPGGSYDFGGQLLSVAGNYQQNFQTAGGCDSLVTLNLTVSPMMTNQISASICPGGNYNFGGQSIGVAGVYEQIYQTTGGCDSLVILTLNVNSQATTQLTATICEGSSFAFGNSQLNSAGSYQQQLVGVDGCDSLVILNLSVLPIKESQLSVNICQGESYLFGNQLLTASGQYQQILQTLAGCDSLVQLDLTVLPSLLTDISAQICEGETYPFGNMQLNLPGIYEENHTSISGCDSTVILTLSVLPKASTQLTGQICEGEVFYFGDLIFNTAGVFNKTYQTWQGCDSVVTLELEVFPVKTSDVFNEICEGEPFNGVIFHQNTVLFDTLSSVLTGCDSIVKTHLTVWSIEHATISAFRCWGEEYEGQRVFSDTVMNLIGQTVHGCDSFTVCNIEVGEHLLPEVNGPSIICSLETATLKTNSFQVYLWSTGETTPEIMVDTAGNYQVTVTDADGCSASASHFLEVSEPKIETAMIEPLCFGDANGEIHLKIEGGKSPYRIFGNGQDFGEQRSITGLVAGLHSLVVIDSISCVVREEIYLPQPPPFEVVASESQEMKLGEEVQLEVLSNLPIGSLQWSPTSGLSCDDCPNPIAMPHSSVDYHLFASNINGCEAESTVKLIVRKEEDVYVPTAFSPNGDGTNDFFTLYPGRSVLKIRQLLVFDRWGEQVFGIWNAPPFHPSTHWHGDFRNMPAQSDVYVWTAEIEYIDGRVELLKGDVSLLK